MRPFFVRRTTLWATTIAISTLLAAQAPQALAPGSGFGDPVFLASLQNKKVNESSGIVVSRRTPGVFWTHNDSGDGPNLFATDRKGRSLASFTVTGATNVDW